MEVNTIATTPDQAEQLLESAFARKASLMLWGEPGIGKSTIIKEFAKKIDADLIDVRLTTLEPSDLRGLPHFDEKEKRTVWYLPEFVPTSNKNTIIFLDELTAADPRLQASAYELVLDRRIGGKPLPPNTWVVAAGNRIEDGSVSFGMGAALADRFQHIMIIPDVKSWIGWGEKNNIHVSVLTFIKLRGDYLSKVSEGISKGKMVVPTPRSWERVSDILHYHAKNTKVTLNSDVLRLELNGYVGQETTSEFLGVLEEIQGVPAVEDVLKASASEQLKLIPDTLPALYALTFSMAAYANKQDLLVECAKVFTNLVEKRKESTVPYKELRVLAMDSFFRKAIQLGILSSYVRQKEIVAYMKEEEGNRITK